MTLKKKSFGPNEFAVYDEALAYKRGDRWQFRMWLASEKKYVRLSLDTKDKEIAESRAKKQVHELNADQEIGKRYFSKTAKQGVDEYLKDRETDVEDGEIVIGRYRTIKTHLQHWLEIIGPDTKLKDLQRGDCENYSNIRKRTTKERTISQTTVLNEQSTINAMMGWLYTNKETEVERFKFKRLKRVDRGNEENRRPTFTRDEIGDIRAQLENYIAEAKKRLDEGKNLEKFVIGYYLLLSIFTGLRKGEQVQLRWGDVSWEQVAAEGQDVEDGYNLVHITVRFETSKVRKTRSFMVHDHGYFHDLSDVMYSRYVKAKRRGEKLQPFGQMLIFSTNGHTSLITRTITYHFKKILELAGVKTTDRRVLVPYSFRHYFITDLIDKGATIVEVANTCGTSITQIERTYYHTTKEAMIAAALPHLKRRNDVGTPPN